MRSDLRAQAFVPYGNVTVTAALPIPTSLQPKFVASASNISYADIAASDLLKFAGGATTYFGLRFTGESFPALLRTSADQFVHTQLPNGSVRCPASWSQNVGARMGHQRHCTAP